MNSLRLVQLSRPKHGRFVARVDEPKLTILRDFATVYELATAAISTGKKIADLVRGDSGGESVDYDAVYRGESEWKLLPAFDHPHAAHRCLVTGTGLTHKASAENRQSMHETGIESDSMKMFRMGVEGGRPEPGKIGVSPEWFYKGVGTILRGHGQELGVPVHGDDGGDEAEIAGVYVIGPDSTAYRVGLLQGNEFSDHVQEAKNYLYLAASKLCACSIGPELVIDPDFSEVNGQAWIERHGEKIWQAQQRSGEKWMSHTLANLEHHHFKHGWHRVPGDAHIHFFGADNFSFRQRLKLEDGDEMVVAFEDFGRPLCNPIRIEPGEAKLVTVKTL
jgi:hypothetical protein